MSVNQVSYPHTTLRAYEIEQEGYTQTDGASLLTWKSFASSGTILQQEKQSSVLEDHYTDPIIFVFHPDPA